MAKRLLILCEYPTLLGGEHSMLSTLPAGPSRWLRFDLPSRMQASFVIPVVNAETLGQPELVA